MAEPCHTIRVVSKRTGLSPHVIRSWERRYAAVCPTRTETNRRLYCETAVARLMLLRLATEAGHSISQIARLADGQLRQMVDAMPAEPPASRRALSPVEADTDFVVECLDAIRRLDTPALEERLRTASVELGSQGLLQKLAAPLAQRIGDLWQSGEITAAHEHFASAVLRVFLSNLSRSYSLAATAPTLVVATPSGQLHELGAVLVAAAAGAHGWRVTYLGVSLPAAEIAGAAIKNRAKAVALSLVYPSDDPKMAGELESLRRFLPGAVKVIVGGRATRAYADAIERSGAIRANSIEDIYQILDTVRVTDNGNGR